MLAALLVIAHRYLNVLVQISATESSKIDGRICPLGIEIIGNVLRSVYHIPYVTTWTSDLALHFVEGIRLAKHSLGILELDALQCQSEGTTAAVFFDVRKDGPTSLHFLGLDVTLGAQDAAEFELGRSHGLVGALADFVVDANRNVYGMAELIVKHEDFGPIRRKRIFDDLRFPQNYWLAGTLGQFGDYAKRVGAVG